MGAVLLLAEHCFNQSGVKELSISREEDGGSTLRNDEKKSGNDPGGARPGDVGIWDERECG